MLSTTLGNKIMPIPFKGVQTQKQEPEKQRDTINVAINGGMGRIGKSLFRMIEGPQCGYGLDNDSMKRLNEKAKEGPEVKIVAINISKEMNVPSLVSALKYDTTLRHFPGKLSVDDSKKDSGEIYLKVSDYNGNNEHAIRIFDTRDTKGLKWDEVKADIVIDATGAFKTAAKMQAHIDQGALRGIITAPNKDKGVIKKFVSGVNSQKMTLADKVFSSASCTTTCIAPIIKALHDEIGVDHGFVQTTHSATATQFVQDKAQKAGSDGAKGRSAFNIIPSTTGAAKAIGEIIPELDGKLTGLSARVPVANGSLAYIVLEMEKPVTKAQVVEILKNKAATPEYRDLLKKADADMVSSDIQGMQESAIYIENQIEVIGDKMVIVPAFYDNEWGYTRSVLDMAKQAGQQLINNKMTYAQQAATASLNLTA